MYNYHHYCCDGNVYNCSVIYTSGRCTCLKNSKHIMRLDNLLLRYILYLKSNTPKYESAAPDAADYRGSTYIRKKNRISSSFSSTTIHRAGVENTNESKFLFFYYLFFFNEFFIIFIGF